MNDDDRSLSGLIQEMLDGALDDDQRADLLNRVEADDAARKLYLDQISTHTALQATLADCLPSSMAKPNGADDATPADFASTSRWPAVAAIASLAAGIILLVGGIVYLRSQNSPIVQSVETPHVAVITQAVGAYDGEGVAIRSGQQVMSGQIGLERGLVRLDFVNGARVAVEGPARVEIVDEKRVVLLSGIVTATVPESAVGFVVDTDTVRVVDLGTSFGVSVGEDGTTDVCVFDGEVLVRSRGSASSEPTRVRQGQAVRASGQSPSVDATDYEVAPFEKAWPVNSGVLQTTGSMRFVSPGPDFHPGNYEDNEHLVVFPERSGVVLQKAIRADMVDPGEYAKSRYREKRTLPAGQRITSYLLQFDAFPSGNIPNRKRSVRGQITFDRPIVAVITTSRLLKESEAIFGNPGIDYPTPREVEPRPDGDERPGFDSVILAADRRTLILDLQVAPNKLDQLRVLVQGE